jgi:mRNA interferase HigB
MFPLWEVLGDLGRRLELETRASNMVVVGKKIVENFLRKHQECRQEVSELIRDLEAVQLVNPDAVRARYPSAKVLDGRVVVFKVRGNRYRLSAQLAYNTGRIVVLALETHAEYDRRTLR